MANGGTDPTTFAVSTTNNVQTHDPTTVANGGIPDLTTDVVQTTNDPTTPTLAGSSDGTTVAVQTTT